MPRKYEKKGIRVTYDPACMTEAIAAVRRGLTLCVAAERFKVPFGTLCKHYKKEGDAKIGGGRKPELSEKDERDLAKYLQVCALHGEGLTRKETIQLVAEFVNEEKIETGKMEKVRVKTGFVDSLLAILS